MRNPPKKTSLRPSASPGSKAKPTSRPPKDSPEVRISKTLFLALSTWSKSERPLHAPDKDMFRVSDLVRLRLLQSRRVEPPKM